MSRLLTAPGFRAIMMTLEVRAMKKDGLLAEILNAVVNHERRKVRTQKPDYYLNQKKQLWYAMMNRVDGDGENENEESGMRNEE